jgi:subtilisin family serine protease
MVKRKLLTVFLFRKNTKNKNTHVSVLGVMIILVLSIVSSSTLFQFMGSASGQGNADNLSSASLSSASLPGPNPNQQSLLQYCRASPCSPSITFVNRDIYQSQFLPLACDDAVLQLRPELVPTTNIQTVAGQVANLFNLKVLYVTDLPGYKAIAINKNIGNTAIKDTRFSPIANLPCDEFILQLRPELLPTTNIQTLAGQIARLPGVYIHQVYDLPTYKAIAVRTDVNNNVLNDARFLRYNLPNNIKAGELNQFEGHIAQLKWNQTLPDGIKRTTPINMTTNATNTGLAQIKEAPAALEKTKVNADIAILDTGISLTHPDLNVYRNVSFVEGTTSGNDDNGHGSHVAGIAAAKDNNIGVLGSAPGARLWAIKVCGSSGQCEISNEIKGIEYAIKHANEIDVLNISIENPNSPALNNILAQAVKAGITVVVSAGNWGKNAALFSPANNPLAITVSAMGDSDGKCGGVGKPMVLKKGNSTFTVQDDTFAFFSNFGPNVKLAAPGVDIFSTYNGTGYSLDSGTSMAAPYVAGAAAVYKAQFPKATPSEVLSYLQRTGSTPATACDGGAHGYFSGAPLGSVHEPLLFRNPVGFQRTVLTGQDNISSTRSILH